MRSVFFFITFLSSSVFAFCQNDTIIYFKANRKPATEIDAIESIQIEKIKDGKLKIIRQKKIDDKWISSDSKEIVYLLNDSTLKIKSGNKITLRKYKKINDTFLVRDYYKNKQLKKEGFSTTFLPIYFEGKVMSYYESGQLKSIEYYKNNQLQSNQYWLRNGEKYFDNIFSSVDTKPEFLGGQSALRMYIAINVSYPQYARENGIQGDVYINFVVDEKGEMDGVYVYKGVDPIIDKEALKVISGMDLKWKPGILDGKKVKVLFTIPVTFKLD